MFSWDSSLIEGAEDNMIVSSMKIIFFPRIHYAFEERFKVSREGAFPQKWTLSPTKDCTFVSSVTRNILFHLQVIPLSIALVS